MHLCKNLTNAAEHHCYSVTKKYGRKNLEKVISNTQFCLKYINNLFKINKAFRSFLHPQEHPSYPTSSRSFLHLQGSSVCFVDVAQM